MRASHIRSLMAALRDDDQVIVRISGEVVQELTEQNHYDFAITSVGFESPPKTGLILHCRIEKG